MDEKRKQQYVGEEMGEIDKDRKTGSNGVRKCN
jgi:hypothetical protein